MDFRFFNGALSGLAVPYLRGGETVRTGNLTPDATFSFAVLTETVKIGVDIGQGISEPEVVMHTVMIRMEDRQVDLVWRGAVPYAGPEWLPQMPKLDIFVE